MTSNQLHPGQRVRHVPTGKIGTAYSVRRVQRVPFGPQVDMVVCGIGGSQCMLPLSELETVDEKA